MRACLQHRLWSAAALLLAAFPVLAQSDKPFAAPETTAAPSVAGAGSLAQVTFSLLLVLGAVFAAAWVMRRLRGLGKFGSQAITVIADVGLGPKERAVLVQVGGKQLLLGVAPGRVSTLYVLDQPVGTGETPARTDAGTDAGTDATCAVDSGTQRPLQDEFKAILKRSLGLKQ